MTPEKVPTPPMPPDDPERGDFNPDESEEEEQRRRNLETDDWREQK